MGQRRAVFDEKGVGIPQHQPQETEAQRPLNDGVFAARKPFLIQIGRHRDAHQTSRRASQSRAVIIERARDNAIGSRRQSDATSRVNFS